MMRALLFALLSLFATSAFAATPPKVVAVKFHADWCGSCQKMGDAMTHLQNKYDGKPVLFVTLDLTNQTARNQAELLATRLGLGALWDTKKSSTGFIALVDAQSGKVVDTLTSDLGVKQMGARIVKALGG
jgi:thiol-disulfide isomerase/thioredoxin